MDQGRMELMNGERAKGRAQMRGSAFCRGLGLNQATTFTHKLSRRTRGVLKVVFLPNNFSSTFVVAASWKTSRTRNTPATCNKNNRSNGIIMAGMGSLSLDLKGLKTDEENQNQKKIAPDIDGCPYVASGSSHKDNPQ